MTLISVNESYQSVCVCVCATYCVRPKEIHYYHVGAEGSDEAALNAVVAVWGGSGAGQSGMNGKELEAPAGTLGIHLCTQEWCSLTQLPTSAQCFKNFTSHNPHAWFFYNSSTCCSLDQQSERNFHINKRYTGLCFCAPQDRTEWLYSHGHSINCWILVESSPLLFTWQLSDRKTDSWRYWDGHRSQAGWFSKMLLILLIRPLIIHQLKTGCLRKATSQREQNITVSIHADANVMIWCRRAESKTTFFF